MPKHILHIWGRTFPAALALIGASVAAQDAEPKSATPATRQVLQHVADSLPFSDKEDFALAERGLIAAFPGNRIVDDRGRVIRDLNAGFFAGPAPDTVNPSLWRDAQLVAKAGLFKVTDRIYQIRGIDISNMSIVVGDKGYIVIDPLVSVEMARAALRLVRDTLGDRPVTGMIYTHTHIDHFGGAAGVLTSAEAEKRSVPILAPAGFMKEVISENVIAGPAMTRRIEYMSGSPLAIGPRGAVSSGIGQSFTRDPDVPGTISLVPPTREITHTGEVLTIDGVRIVFQLTPGTEAPAEMNFYFPQFRALCAAENANGALHNILTPRGALVRDAKDWANRLTETIRLFGDDTDVVFTSHFWPRWGNAEVSDFLSSQRDMYEYLHDQSVRMMNNGLTGPEIGAAIALPKSLAARWFNREYYGTMSFNAHAVYQRYMGWYDGNPVHLNPIPPEEAGRLYVEAMGGPDKVTDMAQAAFRAGEYQWASELLYRVVFADGRNMPARYLLADSLEQLGYQAESAVWRNMYLSAAQDLRLQEVPASRFQTGAGAMAALPLDDILDTLAVRIVPERALKAPMKFVLSLGEGDDAQLVEVRNGVLIHQPAGTGASLNKSVTIGRADFLELVSGSAGSSAPASASRQMLKDFAELFEAPKPGFGLVLPHP